MASTGHTPASAAWLTKLTSRPADPATAASARNSATRSSVMAIRRLPVCRQSAVTPVSCSIREYAATEAIASRHRSALART